MNAEYEDINGDKDDPYWECTLTDGYTVATGCGYFKQIALMRAKDNLARVQTMAKALTPTTPNYETSIISVLARVSAMEIHQ